MTTKNTEALESATQPPNLKLCIRLDQDQELKTRIMKDGHIAKSSLFHTHTGENIGIITSVNQILQFQR